MVSHVKPYGVLFVLLIAAHRQFFEQICHEASTGIIFAADVNYRQDTWMITKTMLHVHVKTLYVMLCIVQYLGLVASVAK